MTANQYYKQTSDMAYPVKDAWVVTENHNKVIGNIVITNGSTKDAEKILTENDFFAFNEDIFENIDLNNIDNIKFELRFHYDIDNFDIYEIDVCDIINCSCVPNGKVVLSCSNYRLTHSQRPEPVKKPDEEKNPAPVAKPTNRHSIFDIFDGMFKFPDFPRFPVFHGFSDFPKLSDSFKTFEETNKAMNEAFELAKKAKGTKFYNFSCKVDPDGTVHIKRDSNDGTIEKTFKIDEVDGPKKIEAEDEKPIKPTKPSNNKSDLKDLLK